MTIGLTVLWAVCLVSLACDIMSERKVQRDISG